MAGARAFEDLIAWRLAVELRRKVRPLCRRLFESKDFKLHEQVREAARSGPRNAACKAILANGLIKYLEATPNKP